MINEDEIRAVLDGRELQYRNTVSEGWRTFDTPENAIRFLLGKEHSPSYMRLKPEATVRYIVVWERNGEIYMEICSFESIARDVAVRHEGTVTEVEIDAETKKVRVIE